MMLVFAILFSLLTYLQVSSKHVADSRASAIARSQDSARGPFHHRPLPKTSTPPGSATARPISGPPSGVYVDCVHGRDGNSGTRAAPYRSLAQINGRFLGAGVTVWLAAGCTWPGPLRLFGTGSSGRPVVVTAYGVGRPPVITGNGLPSDQPAVTATGTSFRITGIDVSGVAGVGIDVMAADTVLSQDEVDHAGIGILIQSPHVLVTGVGVSDLHEIVNIPGDDNDYGAVGFDVDASDAEIAGSSCINCQAPSAEYGYDGGFVEIWNHGNNLFVHDNYSRDTNGYLEIGGNSPSGSAQHVVLERNVMIQVHGGLWIHTRDRFAIPVGSILFAHNTVIDAAQDGNQVIGGALGSLTFENNVIYSLDQVSWSGAPLVHLGNVYYVPRASAIGFTVNASERVFPLSAWPTSLPKP
jgi:hypothetical protein